MSNGSATADSAPAPPAPTGPHVFDEAETRRRLNTGELYTDFGPGLEALEAEAFSRPWICACFWSESRVQFAPADAALTKRLV